MTSTALDLNHAATALAIQPGQISWDSTQIAALAQIGLADASDGDRAVFLHVCQRTGLDPFARQIYMIARNEKVPGTQNQWRKKWTIQTGIDGFRVNRSRAERNAGVRGVLGRALFYDHEGKEYRVWVQPRPPAACEITYTVKDRDGSETPYTSVLRFAEYCQTGNDGNAIAQWATKPAHMLEKCTEADVYRKAFPQDFSGIYLDDAMPQDTPPADGTPGGRPRGRVTAGEVIGRGAAEAVPQDGTQAPPQTVRRGKAAGDGARDRPRGADVPASAQEGTGEGQPLPPPAGETPAEDQPGSASKDQLTRLHTILTGLGFGGEDREQKLVIAEVITRRAPLTGPEPGRSSKNLSYAEAAALISKLDEFVTKDGERDRDALIAFMAEREQAGDGDG